MQKLKAQKTPHFSNHPEPGYMLRGRIWLEKDGELYVGWGRVMLLERIDKFGSIAGAAKSMGLGYRNAWLWVEAMNRLATEPLVEKSTGGVGGGHAKLTIEGQKVISEYKGMRTKFLEFLKQET